MDIGFIGLGKMGSRMAERLLDQGCEVVIYARNPDSMVPLARKFLSGILLKAPFKKNHFPHGDARKSR